ncbi:MAG TPA: hypothetical protein VGL05_30245 [Kribbella sp.]
MTAPDQSAVDRAFAVVAGTQADLYDLKDALDEQTSELAYQLRLYGMQLHRADEHVDPELVHRLYWETPSLSAQAIYEAFALRSPGEVYKLAGPHELGLPCKDCQTVITYQVKNRTELGKLRSNHRCEECAAKEAERQRQARARSDAEWARMRQEEDEALHQAMVAYVLAHPDLPDEPEGESMYVEISGHPNRGGATVSLGALNALRDELRDRLQPKS